MAPTKISLSLSCTNLSDHRTFGKGDPRVVVKLRNTASEEWQEVGKTEVIKETDSPEFVTQIVVNFRFELPQTLRFFVFDVENAGKASETQNLVGASQEILLGEILRRKNRSWTGPVIREQAEQGNVKCVADQIADNTNTITLQFAGQKLDSKDFIGKSDPFLVIERGRDDGSWVAIHKTEAIDDDSNPVWKKFTLPLAHFGVTNQIPIRLSVYDDDGLGRTPELIGQATTNLEFLTTKGKDINWALVDPKKKSNGGIAGTLRLLLCDVFYNYTFLDYLSGGCELSLITAIDYTASNGPVTDVNSLHHMSHGKLNSYETAIHSVGSVLAPYDSDGNFQVMGFGAKIDGQANFCFGLTGAEGAAGVGGILDAYRKFTATATLWGPTNFAPTIRSAMAIASQYQTQASQKYFVLLIITDGAITDLDETKLAIIEASRYPLSIVIVGVGPADFTNMNALDSDKELLSHNGNRAVRDIVQFVAFREQRDPAQLSETVLAEIPSQVLSFFRFAGFVPNLPRH